MIELNEMLFVGYESANYIGVKALFSFDLHDGYSTYRCSYDKEGLDSEIKRLEKLGKDVHYLKLVLQEWPED